MFAQKTRGLHVRRGAPGVHEFRSLNGFRRGAVVAFFALIFVCAGVAVKTMFSSALTPADYTATASQVQNFIAANHNTSINDIISNFDDAIIIELPAGNYTLTDNLVIDKRLILRSDESVKPEDVVIDGQASIGVDGAYAAGYYVDMAHAGVMIDGVTLTHLGTSEIDYDNATRDYLPAQYTGYSIAVRGGTLNRSIIVDNLGVFTEADSGYDYAGTIIGLQSGTLSGCLVARNGFNDGAETISAIGTSHLVGNTIVGNASNTIDNPWLKSSGATVTLWDDPILENNVVAANEFSSSYPVVMSLRNYLGVSEAQVEYADNWIHKETENNIIETDGENMFTLAPAGYGASTLNPLPTYDYSPSAGSVLIDAGTDVFYPTIPKDLNNNVHFMGNAPDLGAYESAGQVPSFEQYPSGVAYVTENGSGNNSGSSWDNALDGNGVGGPQQAIITAVRGGAQEVWFAQGGYEVFGRELLYTRQLSHYGVEDGMVGGVWSGLLVAPVMSSDGAARDLGIYGGFAGNETDKNARRSFRYVNAEGTEIGTTLRGTSQNSTTHFIGQRGYALDGGSNEAWDDYIIPMTPMQPDKYNLINKNDPTLREPTLPSQGVHVVGQVEYGRTEIDDTGDGTFWATIDGVEISNGFSAIYSPYQVGSDMTLLNLATLGGAGINLHKATIKNTYVHDNYDAVANFFSWHMTCGGGIFLTDGVMDNVVVTSNVSETTGGGILSNRSRIYGSYVADNYAFKEGGGINTGTMTPGSQELAPAEITNTVVTNNHTLKQSTEMFADPTGDGGGIWMSAANYTKLQDVTVYGNTSYDGHGDNIYFGGGKLINVVSQGSTSETVGYNLTVDQNGDYAPYASSLNGKWVKDTDYAYEDPQGMMNQVRYVREGGSRYYFYIVEDKDYGDAFAMFTDLDDFDATVDDGWDEALVGIVNGWSMIISKDVPNTYYGYYEFALELSETGATSGEDIYVGDDANINDIMYSAFGTVAGKDTSILSSTNITNLSSSGVFEDIGRRNYRLVKGSPLIGAGVPITGIDADIASTERISSDIGAYAAPLDLGVPSTGLSAEGGDEGSNVGMMVVFAATGMIVAGFAVRKFTRKSRVRF